MPLKSLSKVSVGASRFSRLPNGFKRSSKLTQTMPIDGDNVASIRVVIGTTAVGNGVFNRSATAGLTIGVSASGQQTDQQHYGTATVGVVISSTASASVTSTHSGTATASIVITTTAAGDTGAIHSGTANIGVTITASASGTASQTHAGVASCQVNLSVSAVGFNTNTTVPDETSNGNNMTLYADGSGTKYAYSSDAAIGTRSVEFEGSATTDGTGGYGIIDNTFQSVFRSSFSVSAWVKLDDGDATNSFILGNYESGGDGGNNNRIALYFQSGDPAFYYKSGTVAKLARDFDYDLANGQSGWIHLVGTYNATDDNMYLYVNGTEAASNTTSTDPTQYTNSVKMRVNKYEDVNSNYIYTGKKIDDISIWSKALSSTEVSNLYNSGSGSSLTGSSDLEGWWKMGDHTLLVTHSGTASCQVNLSASAAGSGFDPSNQVPDESGNGNTMTLVSSPSSSTTPSFSTDAAIGSKSVDFDKSSDHGATVPSTYEDVLNSPFTFSAWLKPDDGQTTATNYIFHSSGEFKRISGTSPEQWAFQVRMQNSGDIVARIEYWSGTASSYRGRQTVNPVFSDGAQSSWTHLAVTVDSTCTPVIYINGSSVTVGNNGNDTLSLSDFFSEDSFGSIGSHGSFNGLGEWVPSFEWDGKLDDISIWSTSLTSTQISSLYNSGNGTDLTGSSNLAAWWKMGDSNIVTHSGTASIGVTISATADGTASITHSGTATVSVAVTASASGETFTTHSGTASCQVNLSASASGTASTPVLDNDYAVSCDGTDDYIDLNSNFSSVFNSDFSVAFWINLPEGQPSGSGFGTGSNPNIFGLSNSGNAHRFFGLIGLSGASDAGKLRVYYKAGGTQVHARSASAFFSSGATGWVHVVVTVEEGSNGIKMYKNGSAVSVDEADNSMSSVTMSNFAGNVDMVFGASNRSGTPNYETDADFDEIAIFNTALSSTQVSTIYNSGDAYDLDGHSNLEGWWRMEEGSGTSVADSSSNSNTATLVNGPTFSTDVPVAYTNEYSLDFDGTDDYLEVSDHDDLSFGNSSTDSAFTMAGWVKLDSTSLQRFITKSTSSTAEYIFGTGSGSNLLLALYDDTTSVVRYRLSSATLSTGTWTHVAVTHSGGTIKLFINGSEDSGTSGDIGSYTAMHNSTGTVRLGAYENGSQYTNGKLDELAIWDEALTSAEITAMYNSGSPLNLATDSGNYASSANLTAWWRLENNTNDSSGNGHNGTVSSSPTFSTDTAS